MCIECDKLLERELMIADVNSTNARSIADLAGAAATLATQVPGSEKAVASLVARIEGLYPKVEESAQSLGDKADDARHDGEAGVTDEDLPEEILDLIKSLGRDSRIGGISVVRFPKV